MGEREINLTTNDEASSKDASKGADPRQPTRLPNAEKDNRLEYLKSRWTNPQRLRTHHLIKVREIKSREQGFDGRSALCFFCKKMLEVEHADIHHIDHDVSNNQLSNLEVAHGKCNDEENAGWRATRYASNRLPSRVAEPKQGESEIPGGPGVGVGAGALAGRAAQDIENELASLSPSSRESAKAAIMRPAYDRWVRDLVNGPFSEPYRTSQGRIVSQYSWNVRKLAEAAVYGCSIIKGKALGSSKTYAKYVKEDTEGGILIRTDEGELSFYGWNVRLNAEYLKALQEQSGI